MISVGTWWRDAALVIGIFAAILLSASAFAREPQGIIRTPGEIEYRGPLKGLETSVLYGDPAKPGLYVMRVKFPPGLKIQPHWHPEEMRTVAVISGTLLFAFGDQWDEAKMTALPPGSFFAEPSKTPHYAWAKDGEVVLHLTAIGPTATTMVYGGSPVE